MNFEIRQGDALALLREMPDASIDAIVTDPPYGIGFMGKEWDGAAIAEAAQRDRETRASLGPESASRPGRKSARSASAFGSAAHYAGPVRAGVDFQHWCSMWAAEALRVAKPGAHLVAFGGSRTYHRLACAIEDAGWEVRDCLMWLYGSGFPKSLDVSKAIDKAAGAERGISARSDVAPFASGTTRCATCGRSRGSQDGNCRCDTNGTPATEAAREWSGWGTALKPAHEPIILARKPFSGTVAANVLEHGTGALNVDGCRVPTTDKINATSGIPSSAEARDRPWHRDPVAVAERLERSKESKEKAESLGRWPANVLLDEEAAAALDEQSGERSSGYMAAGTQREGIGYHGGLGCEVRNSTHGDRGGASRFFYAAKASAGERHYAGRNGHPTVKPVDLMRWLCRLVTPRGGLVLDPFTGSGSTGVAALAEGFRFLGLEREADYCAMARRRIAGPLFAKEPGA